MKDKAFTLIELLAVIIILGILMLIAIPSVTTYINNSRKNTYVSTINELIKGASNLVNSGELNFNDTDTTYYIPVSALNTENALSSPYGEFEEGYIVVTTDGESFEYYFVGKDETGIGTDKIIRSDIIDSNSINTNIGDISTDVGIDRRHTIVVLNNDLSIKETKEALTRVDGKTGEEKTFLCKRATTLHTETCRDDSRADCYIDGYHLDGSKGTTTIEYGQLGINGVLETGDAFDCDVNEDGTYDSWNERFYYISDYYDTSTNVFDSKKAVMLHFEAFAGRYSEKEDIDEMGGSLATFGNDSYHGPISIVKHHTYKTNSWTSEKLIKPGVRQLRTELGKTSIFQNKGALENPYYVEYPLLSIDYKDMTSRLITHQELTRGCGDGDSKVKGYIANKCLFLIERLGYDYYHDTFETFYIETPYSGYNTQVFQVILPLRNIDPRNVGAYQSYKNAIDMYYDDIDY